MSTETNLDGWYEGLCSTSTQTLESLRVKTFWARTMKSLLPVSALDKALGIPVSNSFLFCGPSGTGKQTLALATAGSMANWGYQLIRVTGPEFNNQLSAKCQILFQQISNEIPMVIVVEDLTGCTKLSTLGMYLGQIAKACKEQKLPVILIVIHEDEEELPLELRRNLYLCRFTLPDKDERIKFFETSLSKRFPLKAGLSARDLALEADGLQLRQMTQSLLFLLMRVKEKAMEIYEPDYDRAAAAIRAKEVTVDLQDFRDIVHRLKTPEKETPAPVQMVSYVPAPTAAPTPAVSATPAKPDSHAEKLASATNASAFFDELFDGI